MLGKVGAQRVSIGHKELACVHLKLSKITMEIGISQKNVETTERQQPCYWLSEAPAKALNANICMLTCPQCH